MTIRLKLDPDRLTLDDLIAIESGNSSALFMRDFLARFVLNGDGDYMAEAAAKKEIGGLTLTELKQATDQFAEGVKELQETIVPPENASK